MEQNKRIAVEMYERSSALFAAYAGAEPISLAGGTAPDWATEAEVLALAGQWGGAIPDRAPVQSVLGRVRGEDKQGYYAPGVITAQAALPHTEKPDVQEGDLGALWNTFAKEHSRIAGIESVDVQEASYLALLQRTCWAVPAPLADGQPPDVSLYDYARVSAALAVSMNGAGDEEPALLIGGDVSGVQDWLYDLSSSGVAKGLRGRSFYLQLLAEVIALHLLEQLGLPSCNLLYAGGGNFYLLAPVSAADRLTDLRAGISRKLLRMHEGALYVALGAAPISREMLLGQGGQQIGQAWDGVTRGLGSQKARRFAELKDEEMAEAIGAPLTGTGKLADTCAVCRRTIDEKEEGVPLDDDSRKCDLCVSFEQLGNQLREAAYLVLHRVQPNATGSPITGWREGLAQFGFDVRILEGTEMPRQRQSSELTRVYYWKDEPQTNAARSQGTGQNTVWTFRPLAQCTPIAEDGEIATFDALQSDGIERWGVLRMDVDNLGKIFQEGIPGSSLSRVVGLSALLRLYFEGHVPTLAQKYNRDKDGKHQPRMYLMYAGGDDLFIVGGWSDLPHLAYDIRQDFAKFACDNPKLTISGGISIALDKKYPLYQAARDAGDAEHRAKQRNGKDALSFLGEVMGWGQEYDRVKGRVDDLKRWLGDSEGKLPRSFLMTLRAIDAEWREWKKQESGQREGKPSRYQHEDKTLYLGPWQWHLIYSLARAGDRSKDEYVRKTVLKFSESIVGGEIVYLGTIARWVELWTRQQEQ